MKNSAYSEKINHFSIDTIAEPTDIPAVAQQLLQTSALATKRYAVKHENKKVYVEYAIADRLTHLDSSTLAQLMVAEAKRKLICTGAKATALNKEFASAEMTAAAEQFELALTSDSIEVSKNLSSPKVSLTGDEADSAITCELKMKGDLIFQLGESHDDIASSIYLDEVLGTKNTQAPIFDLDKELALQFIINDLIDKKLINAAHSISDGGLYTALVQMSIPNGLGFDIEADGEVRLDAFLFGESQGRAIVTVSEDMEDAFIEYLSTIEVPSTLLGHVTKGKLVVDGEHFGFINEAKELLDKALLK